MANWSIEIPAPTGDYKRDYFDLYSWAQESNEGMKRECKQRSEEYNSLLDKYNELQKKVNSL